ncbi:ROK family transcriptional regulator [Kitasatospora cheerisanensis]|uniref:Putative NagC family transcriptional regulator n=1 Tax=Kitasatospora cheerisanensis KCTC 2395 TaxID=1348663 RepID=A0A066YVM9_9ACTN|nr:ROK family transcriptional regulator [Kitasatospora cheerisanensis]KDN84044.1 putative NagC family transcriptional regulator [Kitasatospora cheerisanensis KCTC 2395]
MTAPANPAPSARRLRTRATLLAVLGEHGTLSRAEISRLTGLSRSAVSSAVTDLLDEGLAGETTATTATGRGRRAAAVTLRRAHALVLAFDFGHTHVTAAVADTTGALLGEATAHLDVDNHPREVLDAARTLADRALAAAGHTLDAITAVAAGIPGALDTRTNVVRAPSTLSQWIGMDPAAELGRLFGRPVTVGNDAEMGARGERAHSDGQAVNDLIYVKASTGIGAGLLLDGRIYRGASGISGEIGHIQLPDTGTWCRCGNRGCLESVASIVEVRRRLAHVLSPGARESVELPPLGELAAVPAAARVIGEAGRTIGRVLADLVNCLNPAAIVIGGELGLAGAPLIHGIRESVDRYAQPAVAEAVEIRASRLGLRSELYGAVDAAVAAAVAG